MDGRRKKKALAELTGPYRFMQLIWIILSHPQYEWDVMIRYVDGRKETVEALAEKCRASGLFRNIYSTTESGLSDSSGKKMGRMLEVIWYLVTFRRKKYMKRVIERGVGRSDYDLFCAENSFSFFGSAMMNQSKIVPTILLEDGIWEYTDVITPFGFLTTLVGRFLFWIGIVNFITKKNFKWNRYCYKYASMPDRLLEKDFRSVKKLYANDAVMQKYKKVISRLYQIDEDHYDAMLFTSVSVSKTKYEDNRRFSAWVERTYQDRRVLLKEHPTDDFSYALKGIDTERKYKVVPGELVAQTAGNADIVFMFPSTLMLALLEGQEVYVIHFDPEIMYPRYQHDYDEMMRCFTGLNIHVIEL